MTNMKSQANEGPAQKPNMSSRLIRVFISSTFRDFHAERQLLVTRVFPELRRRCRERLVELVEVDLRWGITEEQAQRGGVLPICLAEIDRCRPYFLALVGQRYGWVPHLGQFSRAVIAKQPWLEEHSGGKSVTELEILHGVLNNPQMTGRAFFYFRASAYAARCGGDFESTDPGERARVEALKNRIRASGFPVFENYPDPNALAELVRDHLWAVINSAFPEISVPDAASHEEMLHEAFRRSRLAGFGGREAQLSQLSAAVAAGARVFVEGEPGSGKSALLANWLEGLPGPLRENAFAHFVGASSDSVRPTAVVRRCWQWLAGRLEREASDRAYPDGAELFRAFGIFLQETRALGSWLWVIDAPNQMIGEGTESLNWLPDPLPAWMGVIVSSPPGRIGQVLMRRGYSRLQVPLLSRADRGKFIRRQLGLFGKQLRGSAYNRLVEDSKAENPFLLSTLLHELRRSADHRSLDSTVSALLAPPSTEGTLAGLLERWEAEASRTLKPGFCRDALSLIEASGTGLTEMEIRTLTNATPMDWSFLLGLVEAHLIERGGALFFSHDLMRRAVTSAWFPTPSVRKAFHQRLAAYFETDPDSPRTVEMLLPQLAAAEDMGGLLRWLADIGWVARAVQRLGESVIAAFLKIVPPGLRPQEAVVGAIRCWVAAEKVDVASGLRAADLLREVNALDPAREAYELLIEAARREGNISSLAAALQAFGESEYRRAGKAGYERAHKAFEEALALRRNLPATSPLDLANTLLGLGRVMLSWLRAVHAEQLLSEAEAIFTAQLGLNDPKVAEVAQLRGLVAYWRGLKGIGRWGAADPSLLEGVPDLFQSAAGHFRRSLEILERGLGPDHPETLETVHYLQEAPYSVGRYEDSLLWLRRLDDRGLEADSAHRYACITALREVAAQKWADGDITIARKLLDEAELRAAAYAGPSSEPVQKVQSHRAALERGILGYEPVPVVKLEELPPQARCEDYTAVWTQVVGPTPLLEGSLTSPWLVDSKAGEVLFANPGRHELLAWSRSRGLRVRAAYDSWPGSRVVLDPEVSELCCWRGGRDTMYAVPATGGAWRILGEGQHDVRGDGPAGWNPVTQRVFQFGGYGFFTYKNWWFEFNPDNAAWQDVDPNRPGVSPFPRSGQMCPGPSAETLMLFSGEGGETGLQREPRARGGLPIASMVGWFTWLRDLWFIELRSRKWTCLLAPNHPSIRQEGAYGFSRRKGLHVLWAGRVPSEAYGQPGRIVRDLAVWDGSSPSGFKVVNMEGSCPPPDLAGQWIEEPDLNCLLFCTQTGLWTCELRK